MCFCLSTHTPLCLATAFRFAQFLLHLHFHSDCSRGAVIQHVFVVAMILPLHVLVHLMKYESDGVQSSGVVDEIQFYGAFDVFKLSVAIHALLWKVRLADEVDILQFLAYL